jgi:hypothetical protein
MSAFLILESFGKQALSQTFPWKTLGREIPRRRTELARQNQTESHDDGVFIDF